MEKWNPSKSMTKLVTVCIENKDGTFNCKKSFIDLSNNKLLHVQEYVSKKDNTVTEFDTSKVSISCKSDIANAPDIKKHVKCELFRINMPGDKEPWLTYYTDKNESTKEQQKGTRIEVNCSKSGKEYNCIKQFFDITSGKLIFSKEYSSKNDNTETTQDNLTRQVRCEKAVSGELDKPYECYLLQSDPSGKTEVVMEFRSEKDMSKKLRK